MGLSEDKILINFQGGAHGHFLGFTLNAAVGFFKGVDPFNFLGASHRMPFNSDAIFVADHFTYKIVFDNLRSTSREYWEKHKKNLIAILIEEDDLPVFLSCMYARAGDASIYFDGLHIDFYNKTKNDRIFDLPKYLKQWSENSELGPDHPDIEKKTLREFLRVNLNASSVFLDKQRNFLDTYAMPFVSFKFADFYLPTVDFVATIKELLAKFGFMDVNENRVAELHTKFLELNRFVGLKDLPLHYFNNLEKDVSIGHLSIMQEAYLERLIEKKFGIKVPFAPDGFYKNTRDIRTIIEKLSKIQ